MRCCTALVLLVGSLVLAPAGALNAETNPAAGEGQGQEGETQPDSPEEPTPAPEASPAPTAEEPSQTPGTPGEAEPSDRNEAPETRQPAPVVRLVSSGHVGVGLLVRGGSHVVTVLDLVRVGRPTAVESSDGTLTRARIAAVDEDMNLALLELEEAIEAPEPILSSEVPAPGDPVDLVGHGGSTSLGLERARLRKLVAFSLVGAQVASNPADDGTFLVDRSPGDGDVGAVVLDHGGLVLGLVEGPVDEGGGRATVLPAAAVLALLESTPPEKARRRPHHLQSWGGLGLASRNNPSQIGGLLTWGVRGVLFDSLRIEPWVEANLGTREGIAGDLPEEARPRDFWWAIEAGLGLGWRLPLFVEGSRDYVVPNLGVRLGWNRFQHQDQALSAECSNLDGADCSWAWERTLDQERDFRAGLDLGLDVRHGALRIGYRFFLDPTDVAGGAMHRILLTWDGFPLPLVVGDSN